MTETRAGLLLLALIVIAISVITIHAIHTWWRDHHQQL